MTSALALPSFKNIAAGLVGLCFAVACLFAAAPQARAQGLTNPQISAILNLLSAFDVDQQTIVNVENILRESPNSLDTEGTGTVLQAGEKGSALGVTPDSGRAPLEVTFKIAHSDPTQDLWLDFGDNSAPQYLNAPCPNGANVSICYDSSYVSHAYSQDGSYVPMLYKCTLHVSEKDCDRSEFWASFDSIRVSGTTAAAASISNSPILSSTGGFTVSGKASNATTLIVSVAPSSYSGATDWQTLNNLEKGSGTAGFNAQEVTVSSGRWSKQFGDRFGAGTYTIRVFDYTSCRLNSQCSSFPLLATGKVTIAPELQNMLKLPYNAGRAPFAATFYLQNLNASGTNGHEFYMLSFGDGEYYITQSVGKDAVEHTYTAAGTYSAKLSQCTLHISEKDCDGWTGLTDVSVFVSQGISAAPSSLTAAPAPDVAGAVARFLKDYSDEFNDNLAAVVAAPPQIVVAVYPSYAASINDTSDLMAAAAMAPWRAAVASLSQIFFAAGVY